jgi:predicted phage terminase large subunit-like protein
MHTLIKPSQQPAPPHSWTEDDIDLYEQALVLQARESLWAFRQYMDPLMVTGWFPYELSQQLQKFYTKMRAGERPKMVIEAPPQHGKSRGLQDFIAWVGGKDPNIRTMYASFSDDLGITTNLYLQRLIDDRNRYGRVFPGTLLSVANVRSAQAGSGRFLRNNKFLEFVGKKGSFRNVTIEGQVSGKSLDLGIVDDPLKGRNEAQSKRTRDKTWAWLMDDFFNRFSEYAGMIITMTRWHVDDPVGRFLLQYPDVTVIKFPALYEPEKPRVYDPRREKWEPLFPEFKSKHFLLERKKGYTQASWESLYQQSPIISGGGDFPIAKVRYAKNLPSQADIKKSVRYWDKAGTEGGGKRTAGVLMHLLNDGRFYISDIRKGQWASWDREAMIKSTAEMDDAQWGRVAVWVEQEPGSGGKESAERTIQNLAGHSCRADKVTGSKEIRAEPYAAQWQGGNVILHADPKWNAEFVDEHETFPAGTFIDQVDAAAGAFAKLVEKHYKYDSSLAWVG